MPANFLKEILEYKRKSIEEKKAFYFSISQNLSSAKYTRYQLFKKQISQPGKINLIAEIKKASPSQGLLREDFNILDIAKIYADQSVAAISVLTEEQYFLGKPIFVKKVSENFNVPVLTKDFIFDPGQIYEARYNGASAVLLIMAMLTNQQVKDLMNLAHSLDLDCLVEIHNEEELMRALDCGAEIIGINNRDLVTFNVDIKTCERLIPKIPKDKVIVAESGIKTHEDVKYLKGLGAHAVLIGETFMREKDIGKKIRDVMAS